MKNLIKITIVLFSCVLFAQTGPGGVGNQTNNVLWLRSDDISLSNGSNVSSWSDFSGNSNTFSQPNALFTPVFITNVVNGYPVVRFNKTNGRIRKTNFTDFPTNAITAIYVNKNNGETNDGILSYASSASNNDYLLYRSNNLSMYRGTPISSGGLATNDNNWHIVNNSWENSNGNVEFWKDGDQVFTSTGFKTGTSFTINGSLALAGEQDIIDGNYDSNQTHFGDFTEIIIYNEFINNAQQIIISNYLSAKYGNTLALNDTYTQDDLANGDFDHHVAGIGQATDGSNHTDSQGTGIININTPSTLSNDDYLFWGEETKDATYDFTTNVTDYTERLNSKWRVSKQNDLGTVSVSVNASDIVFVTPEGCNDLKLIVSNDASFATKTSYDMTLTAGVYTATTVNFTDGDYFTFEYIDQIVLDGTQYYNGSGFANVPDTSDGCFKFLVKSTADGLLPLTQGGNVREIEVETGGVLAVNNAFRLTVTNGIQLDGDIRLINGSQLIQTHTGPSQVTGSGNLYVDKMSNLSNVFQSGYWSSPVTTSGDMFAIGDAMKDGTTPTSATSTPLDITYISTFDGATTSPITISRYWLARLTDALDWDRHSSETVLQNVTEGYNMKSSGVTSGQNYTFVGKPNDGDYSTDITAGNSSLIGNPYPSAMDGDVFMLNNTLIFNTLYFWDGINDNSNTHVRNNYLGGYATRVIGLGTAYNGGEIPGRFISVGQGFFVDAITSGTINFDNSLRAFDVGSPFFTRTSEFPVLRIGFEFEIENETTFHRQLAIGFRGLTNEFDAGYDAIMYDLRATDVSLKVNNHEGDFVITGIEDFDNSIEIPLQLKLDERRNVTFKIDALENFASNNNVFLKDATNNQFYSLENDVVLNLQEGEYNNRFLITFRNSVLGLDNLVNNNNVVVIDSIESLSFSSMDNTLIKNISIHNILGQLLVAKKVNNSNSNIPVRIEKGQVLVIKIELENGQIVTKKLIKK